ncbi:MAG: pentapeptide repeat-containing protein [Bacteroidota bacterium]|nr:pentapeptide repeat-containing protein [Bacteroidota bacterium]
MGDWGEMDLQGIQFKASDLSGGNFFKTDARKTAWTDCRLRDVVFDRTDLREADFRGATDWVIDPAENRLHGARFDANDLTGLVQSLGIQLD